MRDTKDLLANMPPDEREALLHRLRNILFKPKQIKLSTIPAQPRRYFYVYNSFFATVVDGRDLIDVPEEAKLAIAAQRASADALQAWYLFRKYPDKLEVLEFTHSQYVEWLRTPNKEAFR